MYLKSPVGGLNVQTGSYPSGSIGSLLLQSTHNARMWISEKVFFSQPAPFPPESQTGTSQWANSTYLFTTKVHKTAPIHANLYAQLGRSVHPYHIQSGVAYRVPTNLTFDAAVISVEPKHLTRNSVVAIVVAALLGGVLLVVCGVVAAWAWRSHQQAWPSGGAETAEELDDALLKYDHPLEDN